MRVIHLLLFESKHFVRSKSKVVSYLLFVCTCVYAIQNGFELYHKQSETILEIARSVCGNPEGKHMVCRG